MTYAGERVIFDADSHLMELPDFLTAYADPARRDDMPLLGSLATGQFNPGAHIGKVGHEPQTVQTLLELGDRLTHGPKWHDALGSFSGTERGLALDLLGFRRQVIFSSFCARPIFEAEPQVAYAAARAHNRAVAAFCAGDKRLIASLSSLDDGPGHLLRSSTPMGWAWGHRIAARHGGRCRAMSTMSRSGP